MIETSMAASLLLLADAARSPHDERAFAGSQEACGIAAGCARHGEPGSKAQPGYSESECCSESIPSPGFR